MRFIFRLSGACVLFTACTASDLGDAGPSALDAPTALDAPAAFDSSMGDAEQDAAASDAMRDAPVARRDAGPDVRAAVDGALELLCAVPARALCTVPRNCRCGVLTEHTGVTTICENDERRACEAAEREPLTVAFERYGVAFDEAALGRCVGLAHQSYARCLPNPVTRDEQPASCWDAFVVGAPLGAFCGPSGVRCAGGAGICADRICRPVGATPGAPCSAMCTRGLACIGGTCAEPIAAGGECSDHEDCADPELCVGGRCAPPVAEGGACDATRRCAVNSRCEDGTCRGADVRVCPIDEENICASGDDCRAVPVGTCQLRPAAGAACGDGFYCDVGLWCDQRAGAPGVCTPLPGEGEECGLASTTRCAENRICARQAEATTSVCHPPRTLGQRCDDLLDFSGVDVCGEGVRCFDGICSALREEGEPCFGTWECRAGLFCVLNSIVGTLSCARPLVDGEECGGPTAICGPMSYCNSSESPPVCRLRPPLVGLCEADCAPGFVCAYSVALDRSVCQPLTPLGQPCFLACEEGLVCLIDPGLGACVPRICERLPAPYLGR